MNLIGYTPTGTKEASTIKIKKYNGSTSADFNSELVSEVSATIPAHYDGNLYESKTGTQSVDPATIQDQLQGTSSFDKWNFLYAPGYTNAQYKGTQGIGPYQTALIAQNLQKGYRLNVEGLYRQMQGSSWESYRWVISKPTFADGFNPSDYSEDLSAALPYIIDETILQDTGKKYDKLINVNFYGLFGPSDSTISSQLYLVHLYVEDALGNVIEAQRLVQVDSASLSAYPTYINKFTATVDCVNMCVDIQIDPRWVDKKTNAILSDQLMSFSIFRREYREYVKEYDQNGETKTVVGDQ